MRPSNGNGAAADGCQINWGPGCAAMLDQSTTLVKPAVSGFVRGDLTGEVGGL